MTTETIDVAPTKPLLKRPSLYDVILFDDDVSTYQSVINILVNHFNTSEDNAFLIATKVDVEGIASAGVYSKDVAETKISLANAELKISGYPLRIELFEST